MLIKKTIPGCDSIRLLVNREYLRHANIKFNEQPLKSTYQEESLNDVEYGFDDLRWGNVRFITQSLISTD